MSIDSTLPGNDTWFWDVIAQAQPPDNAGGVSARVKRLCKALKELTPQQLRDFDAQLFFHAAQLTSPALQGALFVMHDGLSDEAFGDFRIWIIAHGKQAFDVAGTNPDELATYIRDGEPDIAAADDFARAAEQAHRRKIGPGNWLLGGG